MPCEKPQHRTPMNSTALLLPCPSLVSHPQHCPRSLTQQTKQTPRPNIKPCICMTSLPRALHYNTKTLHAAAVEECVVDSAAQVVRSFYNGINVGDLSSVQDLIAEDCVYEDLIFPRPFVGRKAILEFFKKFIDSISRDLQFVIDDISSEDSTALGVMWHLEWRGKPFPFSKGCSFYRLEIRNGKRQIVYGRDSVEPAIKPGETALVAIRGMTWLLQQFPQLAERF